MNKNFVKVSELNNSKKQGDFLSEILKTYEITKHISNDYPGYLQRFFSKTVPGIFDGNREIINAYIEYNIAGTIILKNTIEEKKVCTLFVLNNYRKCGIATDLLNISFEILGTKQPLITMSDHKINEFNGIIKKYCWKKTQVINDIYGQNTTEVVFNGILE